MIARLWRGRVPVARAEEYRTYQEEVGPPGYRVITGVRRIYMLGREVDELYEIAMLTFWDSLAAVRAFAGDPIDRARYYDRDFQFLVDPPEHVEHFDVLASESPVDERDSPERVARLWRVRAPRVDRELAATTAASTRAASASHRGIYVLARDVGPDYEVATVTLWDAVNGTGPIPPGVETFDILVREVIAASE